LIGSHYLSPLHYERWNEVKNTSLYALGIEFDLILDDTVLLCKKWSGPVKLKIVRNAHHSAVPTHFFNETGKAVHTATIDMIQEAFDSN